MINSWKDIKHVVFWSGGFDSTALLIDTAARFGTYNEPVLAVSIYDKDAISNAEKDKVARDAIKDLLLNKHHMNIIFHERQNTWMCNDIKDSHKEGVCFNVNHDDFWLGQAYYWFAEVIQNFLGYDIDVHLAYVKGDDFWHIKHRVVAALQTLMPNTKCRLNYDYEAVEKETVYRAIKTFNEEIFKLCSCCEGSKDEPCGECASCKKHLKTLFWLEKEAAEQKKADEIIEEVDKAVEKEAESIEPTADYNDVMNVTKDERSMTLDEYAESWGVAEPEPEPEVVPSPEEERSHIVKKKKVKR